MICTRRTLLAAGLSLAAPSALAAGPASGRLAFAVYRNEVKVGEHIMVFTGDPSSPVVTTDVAMQVRLGPVPVYRYTHHAVERWAGGRFTSLDTNTNSNGKREKVTARRSADGLTIETLKGPVAAPAAAAALHPLEFRRLRQAPVQSPGRQDAEGIRQPEGRLRRSPWPMAARSTPSCGRSAARPRLTTGMMLPASGPASRAGSRTAR